jgi:MinD superfamily P-loop ATPase
LIISVVSGKGGAGKTTIAASLAHILQADCYDLDVDAPNGEHFLQPVDINKEIVYQQQPVIDAELCNACGTCVQECRFNALYMIHGTVYLTDNLCHSCGLCERVCPHEAVGYLESPLGKVRRGRSEHTGAGVVIGDLTIGSARATFLIQHIVRGLDHDQLCVIDGPPGNSCAAVAAIKPADLAVVVVEPTPFGIHDMLQTLSILEDMNKRVLVIANKSQGDEALLEVLNARGLTLAASLPLREDYHRVLLAGGILSRELPDVYELLSRAIQPEVAAC